MEMPNHTEEVDDEAFARILVAIDNPPEPSAELIELVRQGRAMRLHQAIDDR